MKGESRFQIQRTLAAVGIALIIGFIVTLCVSKDPLEAFTYFVAGPFTSARRLGAFFEAAVPLTFTGLSVSLVFSAGQFNIGADGQFFIGAIAASAAGALLKLPPGVHTLVAMLCGALAGALGGLVPGFLKSRWGASELVGSLMMNYVLVRLGMYFLIYHLKDPGVGALVSREVLPSSALPQFLPPTRLNLGLLVLALTMAFCYYFLYRSHRGYELRMVGLNAKFAGYSGISIPGVVFLSQILSGAIAGLGGSVEILGVLHRFQWLTSPGYGFDGVIIAILARNNPLLVPFGALFLAYLRTGADVMAMYSDVTSEMVSLIQAVIILLVTAEAFLSGYRHRMVVKEVKRRASAA